MRSILSRFGLRKRRTSGRGTTSGDPGGRTREERRRQERSYWRQCPLCSGKDWRGWTCLTCGWECSSSSNGQETSQNLPTLIQAENQDTVMRNSNPCLTEPTKQTEASTTPIPKAAPVGARLDSALARQTRARKAVEAVDKMLTIAKQRMKETIGGTGAGEQRGRNREETRWDQLQVWHRM